jgi:hypothetical protein
MSISVAYTRNVTAFGTVALPQVCLHLISLAMLELKYRSPPGTFQFECAVYALVFFHRFWSKHISAALKKSNLTYEGPLQVVCRDKIFSLVSLSA